MSSARERLLGGSSNGSGMGDYATLVKPEQPRPDADGEGVSLDKGKRKAFIEFVTKAGRSLAIPYHFIDDVESDSPHYQKIAITFVKRDLVTVTLHAAENGTLKALHKRIKAQMIGQVCERDPLKEKKEGAALDPNGDEFAVAVMEIKTAKA